MRNYSQGYYIQYNKLFEKNIMKIILIIITIISMMLFSCERQQSKDLINKISNFIPIGWSIRIDNEQDNQIVIYSSNINLMPDIKSNDPPNLNGKCEIYILIIPRVSPNLIDNLRIRNKELINNSSPQESKDNLSTWYKKNEELLKISDSEPTHYDNNNSYRIKCRRKPKNKKELIQYNNIMNNINRLFNEY